MALRGEKLEHKKRLNFESNFVKRFGIFSTRLITRELLGYVAVVQNILYIEFYQISDHILNLQIFNINNLSDAARD